MKNATLSFKYARLYLDEIRRTVNLDDPSTLWNALDRYIRFCADTGYMISNTSMYFACSVSKESISKWSKGQRKAHNPEYKRFADMAKTICAAAREQYGIEGQVNPILTIFHQKKYDGFRDDPPDDSILMPLEDVDIAKLERKYGGRDDA